MGNVLPAGLGQAPARQAALGAGLPRSAEAVTINKVCGSGMQATIFAHDMLTSGSADVIVAGGMESMSNAPYLSKKYRSGARIGHDTVYDHMMLDGLEDAYEPGRAMGTFAEEAAQEYQFTREDMDAYAIESLRRANEAITSGKFEKEIAPVTVVSRKGEFTVDVDEQPGKGNPGEDPAAARRLRQGRADHRGDLILDQRRRGRAGADPPERRRQARQDAGRARRRPRRARAGAGEVHLGARCRRCTRCSRRPDGASTTSIFTRSMRRSPASR